MHGQQNIKKSVYTSTPPLGFRGLFYGELYFYLYFKHVYNPFGNLQSATVV